jgi:hypothetical protein
MAPLLGEVTARLGCEQWAPIQADLYKLLLYEVRTIEYCPPRHPTQIEPSFLEFN